MTTTREARAALDELIIGELGGRITNRQMRDLRYNVPDQHGYLRVEISLKPRWCQAAVDRWHTTDRDTTKARPWFEEHVWPTLIGYERNLSLPTGGPNFTYAGCISIDDLLAILTPWLRHELTDWATTSPTLDELINEGRTNRVGT